jgi:hypothetical protein
VSDRSRVVQVTDTPRPPEVGGQSRAQASVEIYRAVNRGNAWRVVVLAADDSEGALRQAKALALDLYDEIHDDLAERNKR